MKIIDFIGDIHGHADKLHELLRKLGYYFHEEKCFYTHPDRQTIFVGDYIDRGPKIRETLMLVRSMVDNGGAIALMGNHEYNALCFNMKSQEGNYLREHSIKNIIQHYKTLEQFHNRQEEYNDYINWFLSLPLYYETENFRVVHACWDDKNIRMLDQFLPDRRLDRHLLESSVKPGDFHKAIEETLKGKELPLPENLQFVDAEGALRRELRVKWWENFKSATYRTVSIEPSETVPDVPVVDQILSSAGYYSETEKVVFFGHYWLKGNPSIFRENICCLDYSIAKNGYLVAYSLHKLANEGLHKSNFTFV